jgi:DNA processing protein
LPEVVDLAREVDNPAAMMSRPHPYSAAERLAWLRLIRSENVGPVTFFRLLERFGTADDALKAVPELARRGGRAKPIRVCSKAAAERELMTAEALGARMVCAGEPDYPPLLAATEGAPPCLYVVGHPHVLHRPAIAMVGARNASIGACRFARTLAADLGARGVTVVSGLARGLDTAAHDGALDTGTVGVIAGGIDIFYPAENEKLQRAIAAAGLLVSEMPPGTEPQARHFPRRNRIISGVSAGVVVVEATARSGSLITARYAAEQGREVLAVPGSPLDARSAGPNQLIKDGAVLVQSVDDILDAVDGLFRKPLGERARDAFTPSPPAPPPSETDLATARRTIADSLSAAPVTVDEIIRQCQLSPSVVSMIVLEMELAGRLERHPGNRVSALIEA